MVSKTFSFVDLLCYIRIDKYIIVVVCFFMFQFLSVLVCSRFCKAPKICLKSSYFSLHFVRVVFAAVSSCSNEFSLRSLSICTLAEETATIAMDI